MIPIMPSISVVLNATSAVLLIIGYRAIRRRNIIRHRRVMLSALASSTAFLTVYIINHALNGSTPYPFDDMTRPLYFIVLIPHIILAAAMVPFIIAGVVMALKGNFARHARLMRWVFPVWTYVSATGVLVYLMLYIQPLIR